MTGISEAIRSSDLSSFDSREQVFEQLAEPIPDEYQKKLPPEKGGGWYVPWENIVRLANMRAPGWMYEVCERWTEDVWRKKAGKLVAQPHAHVVLRLYIPTSNGWVVRDSVGIDQDPAGQRGRPYHRAFASGMRRAFASVGMALETYSADPVSEGYNDDTDDAPPPTAKPVADVSKPKTPGANGAKLSAEARAMLDNELPPESWKEWITLQTDANVLSAAWPYIVAEPNAFRRDGAAKHWSRRLLTIADAGTVDKAFRFLTAQGATVPVADIARNELVLANPDEDDPTG